MRDFVERQISEGTHGLIPLGSTGEFFSLDDDEKALLTHMGFPAGSPRLPLPEDEDLAAGMLVKRYGLRFAITRVGA